MTYATIPYIAHTHDFYDIVLLPDPVLKTKASAVSAVDDTIRTQMDRMLATMYEAHGIGLAANQVGVLNRVIVMDVEQRRVEDDDCGHHGCGHVHTIMVPGKPLAMANPEITWSSEERRLYREGCLSIPEQYAEVERPASVRVKYVDYNGQAQEILAEGLLATCIQHEIDHLNGIMFTDHISRLKRDTLLRKLVKYKKENEIVDDRLVL